MRLNSVTKKVVVVSLWILFFLLNNLSVSAYEEIPVTSGGTVTGKVFLKGTPPPTRIFHMVFSPNIDLCTRISDGKGNRLLKEFRVSEEGGLQNVVVAVVGVKKGKQFDYTPEIHLENCRISPFIMPVRNGHPFTIVNKDPVVHDIQGYTLVGSHTFAMFSKPVLPESAATKTIFLREGHYIFRAQCGVHEFMQSWGLAVGNPYFAVTSPDGSFTIPDLPAGDYNVIAWHPHMELQAEHVTAPENGKAELRFEFDASQVEMALSDLQTHSRLETALELLELIPPTVELQTD